MAEKMKMTDRDKTLINILGRMADQIQKQDALLEEVALRLNSVSKDTAEMDVRRDSLHRRTEDSFQRLYDSLSRYRSDMLSLVNEQDRMNKSLSEMQKLVHQATYAVEESAQIATGLDDRVKAQEKAVSELYEHSLKQAENFPKEMAAAGQSYTKLHAETEKNIGDLRQEMADASRNYTKLHADTEKNIGDLHQEMAAASRNYTRLHAETEKTLGDMHRETQRQMEKLEHETLRRLMLLESMDSKLQTLMFRTEPKIKKVPRIFRVFISLSLFFRVKLPAAIKRFIRWLTTNDL
jgi:SMC interacting uncharacterized protein involved in chromosome segregation